MTGFGRGDVTQPGFELTVEIRSVNHRYLELRVLMPPEMSAFVGDVEQRLRGRLARGRIDVQAVWSGEAARAMSQPEVDLARARAFLSAYREVGESLGLSSQVELRSIIEAPGVIQLAPPKARSDRLRVALLEATDAALNQLTEMRAREGKMLTDAITEHVCRVDGALEAIEVRAPLALEERGAKLQARLRELTDGLEFEASRVAQEVAVLVDRSDIAEELERLRAHRGHMQTLLLTGGPVGRRLDFLVQEMNREINTLGAKCADSVMAHAVIELKAELERIREQVQNLE